MPWATAHSTGSAQLADGLRPLAGPVGDQSDGFPDDTDPTATSPRRPGMPPGRLGFVVGQRAGRDEVRGDPIGALLAQPAEVATYFDVQRIGGRPFGQVRPGLADVFLAPAGAPFGFAPDVTPAPSRSDRRPPITHCHRDVAADPTADRWTPGVGRSNPGAARASIGDSRRSYDGRT